MHHNDIITSGSCNKIMKIWDVSTGKCTLTLSAHDSRIRVLAFSPDGKILASCSDDCTVKLWGAYTGENITTITRYTLRCTRPYEGIIINNISGLT